MIILVTGASGFLGSHICRHLLAEGHKVIALIRENSSKERLKDIEQHLEFRYADLLDLPALNEAFEGCEKVVHCAAVVSFDKKDCPDMLGINTEGTRNVVNLCLKYEIEQLVHISSIAAIGRTNLEETLTENSKWNESDFTTCYGKSKYMAELEVWRGISEGLDSTILNPSVIIGTQTLGEGSEKVFDYVKKGRRHYPKGHINVVDVRDVCEIVSKTLNSTVGNGKRFILNGASIPYRDLFQQIAEAMKVGAPDIPTSGWKLQVALFLDTVRSTLTQSPRYMSREIIRNASSRVNYVSTRVEDTFNFTFRPLNESINWIISEQE
jgi:nucleoside-diphosphate-sugar epimerase